MTTYRFRVYLVRLWGGGGLRGRRGVWLPVCVVRGRLVALIGGVRSSDHGPGCLDRSSSIGRSHCVSHGWSLLHAVTGCRGMGIGRGRLGTEGEEREGNFTHARVCICV